MKGCWKIDGFPIYFQQGPDFFLYEIIRRDQLLSEMKCEITFKHIYQKSIQVTLPMLNSEEKNYYKENIDKIDTQVLKYTTVEAEK